MRNIVSALLTLGLLAACASSPLPVYYTLDAGSSLPPPAGREPSVIITQITVPDWIDRPQLVTRTAGHQIRISELERWAEPLRRAIPRVLASEMGQLLDSSRVVALPTDGQRVAADFRLSLDVQRLEAVEGVGVDVDLIWRLEPRRGEAIVGRSVIHEATREATREVTTAAAGNAPGQGALEALVAAHRRALAGVAAQIVDQIRAGRSDPQ